MVNWQFGLSSFTCKKLFVTETPWKCKRTQTELKQWLMAAKRKLEHKAWPCYLEWGNLEWRLIECIGALWNVNTV